MTTQRFSSRAKQVRSFFDTPEKYLDRREFDIRIRVETVQEFTRGKTFDHILDIGCGNGAISLPLLTLCQSQQLTLLDISTNMLALAREKIASELRSKVELINDDLMSAQLRPEAYDLVLCIGVLGHVDSPVEFIAKIAGLMKSGGSLILEVTDSYHPVGRAIALYHRLLNCIKPATYTLNCLRIRDVIGTCRKYQLIPSALYRYSLPPPGSQRLFNQKTLYSITRAVFGSPNYNRNKWLGNEFIYRLDKQSTSDHKATARL